MDFREQRLSPRETKEIDLVNYLYLLGHEPTKIRNQDFPYLSPLREESNPSFKVNRRLNGCYDSGMGKGENLIDFGIFLYHYTVAELLQQFPNGFAFQQPSFKCLPAQQKQTKPNNENKITIVADSLITSHPLLKHLSQPAEIACQFCDEFRYQMNEAFWQPPNRGPPRFIGNMLMLDLKHSSKTTEFHIKSDGAHDFVIRLNLVRREDIKKTK